MNRQIFFFFCTCAALLVSEVHSARILVLYPFTSKSHKNFANPILEVLAIKGHEIVMVSPYKTPVNHPRFKDVLVNTSFEQLSEANPETGHILMPNIFDTKKEGSQMMPLMWLDILELMTDTLMVDPQIQKILEEKWDLVMLNGFVNEFTLGIVHKINKPVIITSAGGLPPWSSSLFGNPSQVIYFPFPVFEFGAKDSFLSRLTTLGVFSFFELYYHFKYLPAVRSFNLKYFGDDLPDFRDILKDNVSLVLTNIHHSIHGPVPSMPSVIEAGGAHCYPAKPLPKDLEEFIEASDNGFIYFSMGSVIQAKTMPEEYRREFIEAFGRLPYRVLWKWETEHMDDLPPNVKLIKWAPQQDILGHPKLRLFISHGGGLSTMETTYHGVPILGFPMFADQPMNIRKAESLGFGLGMNILELTADKLVENVEKMINDKSYAEKVKTLSALFRDQDPLPIDVATYWVEYVLRHNGAKHLRSVAVDMPWYQYHLVDVFVFLGATVILALGLIVLICSLLYKLIRRCVCGKCSKKDEKKKKQ